MKTIKNWTPLEICPSAIGGEANLDGLLGYLSETERIGTLLIAQKALLFRGFGITAGQLDPVLDLLLPNRLAYIYGNSPRSKVGANVYTSTEYPAQFTISMHNELSYAARWPTRLTFFCRQAASVGGATSVVDGAAWLEALDQEVTDAFAPGVHYMQNLHGGYGLGKSWQETFETDDRDEVEAYLTASAATWQWKRDGLRITQTRPATMRHPITNAEVWFNQSDQWHPAALGDDTARTLARIMPEEDLPQSVRFADGRPIPSEYVIQVRDRGLATAVDVQWRDGDVLLIDNVLVAHGRRPFTGERRVLVAMSG